MAGDCKLNRRGKRWFGMGGHLPLHVARKVDDGSLPSAPRAATGARSIPYLSCRSPDGIEDEESIQFSPRSTGSSDELLGRQPLVVLRIESGLRVVDRRDVVERPAAARRRLLQRVAELVSS